MGMYYGGENYIFSKNLQGDVIGIYNESRQLVAKYSYNAYGEIMSITDASGVNVSSNSAHIANINPFRYRGYYYDNETGFYYLQSRYYDPVVGRFLNADVYVSTGQGILGNNMFAYCGNNPIMRCDLYGDCSTCCYGACGPCSNQYNRNVSTSIKECLASSNDCAVSHSSRDYLEALILENYITVIAKDEVVFDAHGVKKTIASAFYIPEKLTEKYYIMLSKDITDFGQSDIWDEVIFAGETFLVKYIPSLGIPLLAINLALKLNSYSSRLQLSHFDNAMQQGGGVLVVNWKTCGARSGNHSHTNYYGCNNLDSAVSCLYERFRYGG